MAADREAEPGSVRRCSVTALQTRKHTRSSRAARLAGAATEPFLWLSIVYLTMLALRLDWMDRIPGWFYGLRDKPLGPPVLIVALAAVPVAAWLVGDRLRKHRLVAVCALIALGFAFQQGFAWSEGRGLTGMRVRIVTSGHAEFAEVAVRQPKHLGRARRLRGQGPERRLGRLRAFEAAGPTAVLHDHGASRPALGARTASRDARLEATRTVAAVTWPFHVVPSCSFPCS